MKKKHLPPLLILIFLIFNLGLTGLYAQCNPNFAKIDVGRGHTLAIKSDGTLWAWGHLWSGDIINPNTDIKTIPAQIGNATNWISVNAGGSDSYGITADGKLWVWGRNGFTDLIIGDPTLPTQIATDKQWMTISSGGSQGVIGITTDGKLWKFDNTSVPTQVGVETNWISVYAGAYNNFAITTDGQLWAWGANSNGELGDGTKVSKSSPVQIGIDKKWIAVSNGDMHTLGITTDGRLWSWGTNTYGQLGNGNFNNTYLPVQIGTATNWTIISAGDNHSLAISSDNKCWAWGNNSKGQLGNGTLLNNTIPTQVGNDEDWKFASASWQRSMAIKTDQSVWGWGLNNFIDPKGILGDGTNIDRKKPVLIGNYVLCPGADYVFNVQSDLRYFLNGCNLLASMESTGTSPVVGNVSARVWVEQVQSSNYVKRHYEITPENNGSDATGRITLYFTQEEFDGFNSVNQVKLPTASNDVIGIANLLIEKRNGISGNGSGLPKTYKGSTTINPSDALIVWNSGAKRWEVTFDVTGFGGFFVKTQSSPLPVDWISVSASLNNENSAVVSWEVIETNVKEYEVQKSLDARIFHTLNFITGKGNGTHLYSNSDQEFLGSTTYYRVKQTDFDGTMSFSRIVSVQPKDQMENLVVYPVPGHDLITLDVRSRVQENYNVTLIDKSGRSLLNIKLHQGKNEINTFNLNPGLYLLKTSQGQVFKLILE